MAALKASPPSLLSIFSPKSPSPSPSRPTTEIRFSRWNNANAEKFEVTKRTQKEIEDEIRRERRYQSVANIADKFDSSTVSSEKPTTPDFKSLGTPSSPSLPSIPGKASKYSKPPQNAKNPTSPQNDRKPQNPQNPRTLQNLKSSSSSHPAFRRRLNPKIPVEGAAAAGTGISISENGIAYRVPNAPFEFQYSYTETPKVKPLALREPYLPFGPGTMPRPWTGRAPLPASKKKLQEFDSFRLPPPHKKGVKPVQAPGPFLPGSGPKYVMSREEIIGEPLTKEEVKDLIKSCLKTRRQLNMGRDGLTHNMLDNIHSHWKRKRVCKIKCKGVCTVDMANVHQQLEEKTGGKIIYSRGGVLFLFRGRNYNYKTRPKFPLMLWKPITPVYPKLIPRVPEGLTLEEAIEMRKRGQKLPPICKLGKNGVYCDLAKAVKEAFEECDLVRINCKGMNTSDYKKIGAKLRDLVPCVLLSFEFEHILMWRGRDWKSSFPKLVDMANAAAESTTESGLANSPNVVGSCLVSHGLSNLGVGKSSDADECPERHNQVLSPSEDADPEETKDVLHLEENNNQQPATTHVGCNAVDVNGPSYTFDRVRSSGPEMVINNGLVVAPEDGQGSHESSPPVLIGLGAATHSGLAVASEDGQCPGPSSSMLDGLEIALKGGEGIDQLTPSMISSQGESSTGSSQTCTEGVLLLWRLAIESGSALVLDDPLDANTVYEKAVALAKTAPPGPVFRNRFRKVVVQETQKKEGHEDLVVEEDASFLAKIDNEKSSKSEKKSSRSVRKNFKYEYQDVIPQGSLGIDELAKLLS
ncbi:hypothetical protein AAC387_Pa04g1187 [Persea americana]